MSDGMAHVVALSGGADSTAMALLLAEREPREYLYVFTPTGNEMPEMVEHWGRLRARLGNLHAVMGGTLDASIKRYNALPSWRMRWCTRELKIEPFQRWIVNHLPCVAYVGLRADEEGRMGADYDLGMFCEMRFPLREWGMNRADVLDTLRCRGVKIPRRTDCAWCFFQRPREWWELWREHPDLFAAAEERERMTGHTWRSPTQGGNWSCGLSEMRARFEAGEVPDTRVGDAMRAATCAVCAR